MKWIKFKFIFPFSVLKPGRTCIKHCAKEIGRSCFLRYWLSVRYFLMYLNIEISFTAFLRAYSACTSDGSGSKIFDPCRVNFLWLGSGQPFMVWVRIWKISPKNIKFFNFFPSGQKKFLPVMSESTRVKAGLASYLLRVKSKLGSGQGPSLACTSQYCAMKLY